MLRFFDILLSGTSLLALSPLLVPVLIILRFTGEREIFYFQERVGRNGKMFKLYKFATMVKNSENMGTGTVTIKNDPRVLPFGQFLRKTKINELPQLLNILNGSMSVIGPRPQTKRCFDAFPENSQAAIIRVRPGLSGVGSIFFSDEEELMHANDDPEDFYDHVIMPYKGNLEEWYVQNQSSQLYFMCIFLTFWCMINPRTRLKSWFFSKMLPPPPELTLEH